MVVKAEENGYADLIFGVQWSWTEPEERVEQLQGLSDCVSQRLDQGIHIYKSSAELPTDVQYTSTSSIIITLWLMWLSLKFREGVER